MVNSTKIRKVFYINWSEKNIKMWESCLDPSCWRYWPLVLPAAKQGTRTIELNGKGLALFVFWCRKPTILENPANGLVVKNAVSASRKLSHKRTGVSEGLRLSLLSLQVFKIFFSKPCQNTPLMCCSQESTRCDKRGKEHRLHSQHKHQPMRDRLVQLQLPWSGLLTRIPSEVPKCGGEFPCCLCGGPKPQVESVWPGERPQHHQAQLSYWVMFRAGRGSRTLNSSLALGSTFLSQNHFHQWRLRASPVLQCEI